MELVHVQTIVIVAEHPHHVGAVVVGTLLLAAAVDIESQELDVLLFFLLDQLLLQEIVVWVQGLVAVVSIQITIGEGDQHGASAVLPRVVVADHLVLLLQH